VLYGVVILEGGSLNFGKIQDAEIFNEETWNVFTAITQKNVM